MYSEASVQDRERTQNQTNEDGMCSTYKERSSDTRRALIWEKAYYCVLWPQGRKAKISR